MTNYGSTPDPSESFNISSDTCPETPDSSVKEEADVNSPDTGSYVCLWQDCLEEFPAQKALVDHITDSHMESKKGCEEFPCLWKVRKKVIYVVAIFDVIILLIFTVGPTIKCKFEILYNFLWF